VGYFSTHKNIVILEHCLKSGLLFFRVGIELMVYLSQGDLVVLVCADNSLAVSDISSIKFIIVDNSCETASANLA